MKAVVIDRYGNPDVMTLKETEIPVPAEDEVLVKVRAVSLNSSDLEFLTARPFYIRFFGPFKPKYRILGSDVAGIVETVGSRVRKFKAGDAVFGDILEHFGGLAEYVCAPEKALHIKPDTISFEEASTYPQAGEVALQALRKGNLRAGQTVLINGAGGGSGTFAVRMAKLIGAEVWAVDNSEKQDYMRSIGADRVLDYTREDLFQEGGKYDLVVDLVARHSLFKWRRMLKPGGRYLMAGGSFLRILLILFLGPALSRKGGQQMGLLLFKNNSNTDELLKMYHSGQVLPFIDKQFSLEESANAFRYLQDGHARGKLVISISP